MATITVNQFNDDGTTARTAGEVMTINGGLFTQRTDTRRHATSPASFTGTFGGNCVVSATLGGGILFDGRNVRWLAYNSGSGNMPAIGTSVTQGGVSGYLLSVHSSLTATPTAVGAAIPASGFMKFREVTGGNYSAGALSGITASATGADVTGWLEIVMDQSGNWNIPRLGNFTVRGKWFYLDNTTGSAGQILQTPTLGGGAGTECPGVWVSEPPVTITNATWSAGVATFTAASHGYGYKEQVLIEGISPAGYNLDDEITIVDANTFTMVCPVNPGTYSSGGTAKAFISYPALKTTAGFTTTNLGTDERSKFVQNVGSGQMRFGSDGTSSIGYVPPAGRYTRIPNVIFRQCTTAARATNAVPHATIATRPDFTTTNAGVIDIEGSYGDWYYLLSQPYSVKLKNFANFDQVNISECATPLDLNNGITGMSANLDLNSLLLTSNFAGGDIVEWGGPRGNAPGTNDHDISLQYCIGQNFYRTRGGIIGYARSSGVPIYLNQCSSVSFYECRNTNGPITINTSFNINVYNQDHVDRYIGATTTAAGYAIVVSNSCDGVKVDGLTFGLKGAIANCHPYSGIISATASSNLKFRNFGTRSNFLSGGSANNTAYAFVDGGNNLNVKCQRIYITPTRTGIHSSINSSKNLLFEDCYGDFGDSIVSAGLNMLVRGGGGTNSVTGQASVYGTHFGGAFTSDTTGRMWLALNEPTEETLQYTSRLFSAGSGFTSAGGLSLATVGDYFICEMQESRLQTTGFSNTAPTITGTNTGNHSFEYQIDTGSGYGGTWKTLNGANLSAETVLPSVGYKLKFKIECTIANNSNLISFVRCDTTSTLADQVNNLYPLDTISLVLTGLKTELLYGESGSDVVIYAAGTTTVRASADKVTGFTYNYETPEVIDIGVFKKGYLPLYIRNLSLGSLNSSLPIAQQLDRAYLD